MGKPFSFLQCLLMLLSTTFSDFADGEMYSWPVGSVAAGASYFGFLALCAAGSFSVYLRLTVDPACVILVLDLGTSFGSCSSIQSRNSVQSGWLMVSTTEWLS
jgi:hypothetical protein